MSVCVLGEVLERVRHQRRVVFYWYIVSKQTCVGVFQSESASVALTYGLKL